MSLMFGLLSPIRQTVGEVPVVIYIENVLQQSAANEFECVSEPDAVCPAQNAGIYISILLYTSNSGTLVRSIPLNQCYRR
jgi:hypothetical protein